MEIVRKGVIYFMPTGIFNFGPTLDNQVWPISMEADISAPPGMNMTPFDTMIDLLS